LSAKQTPHQQKYSVLVLQSRFCLWYKRLEEGVFKVPAVKSGAGQAAASVELKASELAMLLEGIDLKSIKRSKRFSGPMATAGVAEAGV
jgi:hypothetical protein